MNREIRSGSTDIWLAESLSSTDVPACKAEQEAVIDTGRGTFGVLVVHSLGHDITYKS